MGTIDIARGSAWLVVSLFVATLVLEIRHAMPARTRLFWTFGAFTLAAHVAWVMIAIHHGSVGEAYEHTASRTKQLIGLPIGAGVYINFAMLGVWLGDATAWWAVPKWELARQKYKLMLYITFGFLFVNATIVFASSWGRFVGLVAMGVVCGAWLTLPRQAPNGESGKN